MINALFLRDFIDLARKVLDFVGDVLILHKVFGLCKRGLGSCKQRSWSWGVHMMPWSWNFIINRSYTSLWRFRCLGQCHGLTESGLVVLKNYLVIFTQTVLKKLQKFRFIFLQDFHYLAQKSPEWIIYWLIVLNYFKEIMMSISIITLTVA